MLEFITTLTKWFHIGRYDVQHIKSGFSLIELLIVVAIIGILAAIGTVGYQNYIDGTREAVTENVSDELTRTLERDLILVTSGQEAGSDVLENLTQNSVCENYATEMVAYAQDSLAGEGASILERSAAAIYGPDLEGVGSELPGRNQLVIYCNVKTATPNNSNFLIRNCHCKSDSCSWDATCPRPW